jgi:hypothetical protein
MRDPAPAKPRRFLRNSLAVLLAILAVAAAIHESADERLADTRAQRRQIVSDAARLLTPAPTSASPASPGIASGFAIDSASPGHPGPGAGSASAKSGASSAEPQEDPIDWDHLRVFARVNARPRLDGLVHLTSDERTALGEKRSAKPGTDHEALPDVTSLRPRSRIPDAIEQSVIERRSDALSGALVLASLRIFEDLPTPFALIAVQSEPGPARAQLAVHGDPNRSPSSTAWVGVGESPSPGWRVVRIGSDDLIVLSPFGNPARLRVSGADGARAPAN